MKYKSLVLITLSTLLSSIAVNSHAHVRWFIDEANVPNVPFVFNGNSLITFIMIAAYVFGIIACHRYIHSSKNKAMAFMKESWSNKLHLEWYLVFALLNVVLIYCLLYGEYLAPNLSLPPALMPLGIILQGAVLVLLPFSPAIVGLALVVVGFLNLVLFGFAIGVDYFFELVGVGIAFIMIGPSLSRVDSALLKKLHPKENNWENYAILALRLGLGLQLLTLAIHNKFIDTGYSLLFMQENSFYNFMQGLGLTNFSHVDFVYMVGFFETMFGVVLCLGVATRLVSITLAIIFILTAILSGINEVVGHLPIMAVVLVLIVKSESAASLSSLMTRKPRLASAAVG